MGCTWVCLIKIQHQNYSMKEKVMATLSGSILERVCLEKGETVLRAPASVL